MDELQFEREVLDLIQHDYKARRNKEKKLAFHIKNQLPVLKRLSDNNVVLIRRTVVELLRRHAATNQLVLELLIERLKQETDIKTVSRICNALGESGTEGVYKVLLERLETETHRFAQRSIILALGKLGFTDWSKKWVKQSREDGIVGDALRTAIEHAKGKRTNNSLILTRPMGKYTVEIYPGLEPLARIEWLAHGLKNWSVRQDRWICFEINNSKQLSVLEKLRTSLSYYHTGVNNFGNNWEKLVLEGCSIIAKQPKVEGGSSLNFRLSLPMMRTRNEYVTKVKSLCKKVVATYGWHNNPSSYTLELRVVQGPNRYSFLWRDMRWPMMQRQPDRKTVPASIHPSVAAGLCFAVEEALKEDLFEIEHGTPFLVDPCCGAGTILYEWLNIFPKSNAMGLDISSKAIATSRNNLRNLEGRSLLEHGDFCELPLKTGSVDVIIANLPFNIRVRHGRSSANLYGSFVKEADRVLRSGGVLVTYTADRKAMESAFKRQGFHTKPRVIIHAGGIDVGIYRARISS